MALTAVSAPAQGATRNNNTDFSASLTPLEFIGKYAADLKPEFVKLDETDNKHRLALTCKDHRGVLTSAYAAGKLQEMYENREAGKPFELPEAAMVAPWIGEGGRKNWMLYLQGDVDLTARTNNSEIVQKFSR